MKLPADAFSSDSPWMKAADNVDMNRRVKIAEVGQDVLTNNNDEDKDVVWIRFVKAEKPIILSKTNGNALLANFGEETDAWVGKECQLSTKAYNISGNNTVGWIITPLKDVDPEDDIPF
jgi:hypothetical protein